MHLLLSGVFERHERLRFVMTDREQPGSRRCSRGWTDHSFGSEPSGATGELRYGDESVLPLTATEYFRRNCFVGVSQPKAPDVQAMIELGLDRFMWGSDYPHDEGTAPFTREHLRQLFSAWPEDDLRCFLATTAAGVFGFDLEALARVAEQWGPTVEEIREPLTGLPEGANEALVRGLVG